MVVAEVKIMGFLGSQSIKVMQMYPRRAKKKKKVHVGPEKNMLYENKNLQISKLRGDYSYCEGAFKGFP